MITLKLEYDVENAEDAAEVEMILYAKQFFTNILAAKRKIAQMRYSKTESLKELENELTYGLSRFFHE